MSRSKDRADRIRTEVPIIEVLATYGYAVSVDGGREQQFSCDLHGDGSDSKPSARVYPDSNQWYCVDTEAPVLTALGWKPLGEVQAGISTLLDGVGDWNVSPAYYDKGFQPVVTVCTSAGYEVTVTPSHEIFVIGKGWVKASCLSIGDVVDVPKPNVPSFSTNHELPFSTQDLNERSFKSQPNLSLPSKWSYALGLVMGHIFGDGWIHFRPSLKNSHVVGLTSSAHDADNARRVFGILRTWASGRGHERHRTDATSINGKTYIQDQIVWSIGNRGLAEFFARLEMSKRESASERRLPTSLWEAPESALRGFLQGIYATDGTFVRPSDRTAVRVTLYSVSRKFLQDIQLVLLQFGIHSRVSNGTSNRPSKVYSIQLATGEDVLRFRDRIGVDLPRKQAILDSYIQPPHGKRPFRAVISSITESGIRRVADVAMPVEHSFVAGGIRVHNCFACSTSRDAIQTVREKEGLDFRTACDLLEKRFHLPSLPWTQDDESKPEDLDFDFSARAPTAEDASNRVKALLKSITRERNLPLQDVLRLWQEHDRLAMSLEKGSETLLEDFLSLRDRVVRTIQVGTRVA